MLLASLVLEDLLTLVASELRVIERLHHETIDVFAKVGLIAAIWTRLIFCLPLANARTTAQLVAVEAFFWALDDLQADSTGEVLVELVTHGMFGLQVLVSVDWSLNLLHEILDLLSWCECFVRQSFNHIFVLIIQY